MNKRWTICGSSESATARDYSISYNHSHTRGAEAVLKEMFTQTIVRDQQEINRRSNIIKNFASMNMRFPF